MKGIAKKAAAPLVALSVICMPASPASAAPDPGRVSNTWISAGTCDGTVKVVKALAGGTTYQNRRVFFLGNTKIGELWGDSPKTFRISRETFRNAVGADLQGPGELRDFWSNELDVSRVLTGC